MKIGKYFSDWTNETAAFLILRLWLGLRSFMTGFEKYKGVEQREVLDEFGEPVMDIFGQIDYEPVTAYGLEHYKAVADSMHEAFLKEPLLPEWLLTPYYAVLGPALIILGGMLLLGIGTRISLFLMGLIYISLTHGLILLNQDAGISWLGVHIIMIAMALMLVKHNRLAVLRKF